MKKYGKLINGELVEANYNKVIVGTDYPYTKIYTEQELIEQGFKEVDEGEILFINFIVHYSESGNKIIATYEEVQSEEVQNIE